MIIGITGKSGHGKDEIAKHLESKGFIHIKFSKGVKLATMAMFGLTWEQVSEGDRSEVIESYGKSVRYLLQMVGTEWGRRFNKDIWVDRVEDMTQDNNLNYVISDVRFNNEADICTHIIKVMRPEYDGKCEDHESEDGIDVMYLDDVIINNGTIEDLVEKTEYAIDRLKRYR